MLRETRLVIRVRKVPENASVTVTYISQSDAIAFDQWLVSGAADIDRCETKSIAFGNARR